MWCGGKPRGGLTLLRPRQLLAKVKHQKLWSRNDITTKMHMVKAACRKKGWVLGLPSAQVTYSSPVIKRIPHSINEPIDMIFTSSYKHTKLGSLSYTSLMTIYCTNLSICLENAVGNDPALPVGRNSDSPITPFTIPLTSHHMPILRIAFAIRIIIDKVVVLIGEYILSCRLQRSRARALGVIISKVVLLVGKYIASPRL